LLRPVALSNSPLRSYSAPVRRCEVRCVFPPRAGRTHLPMRWCTSGTYLWPCSTCKGPFVGGVCPPRDLAGPESVSRWSAPLDERPWHRRGPAHHRRRV